jgi:hypothetical protein
MSMLLDVSVVIHAASRGDSAMLGIDLSYFAEGLD